MSEQTLADTLDRSTHIAYYRRHLRLLPQPYTSTDLSRLTLIFFCVSALDLLQALPVGTDELSQTREWANWIYLHCMLDDSSGFRGSPGTDSHIASTYFAIATLAILRDDFKRVNRGRILGWLKQCQRVSGDFKGSFAPLLLSNKPHGELDLRFGYCASALRWMLAGEGGSDDYDTGACADFIMRCINYDGGIGQEPGTESHGGLTYCGLSTLMLLNRIDNLTLEQKRRLTRWLVSRQIKGSTEDQTEVFDLGSSGLAAGFNGRVNKDPDTCYSFWIGASLSILGDFSLIDFNANANFLLACTQNRRFGGFGKLPGDFADADTPDVMHSYLGLAALSLSSQEMHLRHLDPALCLTTETKSYLGTLRGKWMV
ncbi:terpenoid cyclases/Protein prenyltransferase [Dipodascopsis tothii]|uniref:terpenoid cyclases/Protein prenyltransferase n=1 Tax=Dipodascopsis tothii TaxID=44089 RepID=UPI0034CE7219